MDTSAEVTPAAAAADAAAEAAAHAGTDAQVRQELARVLASPALAGAPSQQKLLRHLVECSLAGDAARLKESLLGIEVYQRPPGRFDPRQDSIVRVEARRLRARLRQHYEAAGAGSGLAIELPKGSYRPRFVAWAAARGAAAAEAAELVERGNFFLRQGTEDGNRKALARFEQAVLVCPGLAAAHSGVARAWLYLVAYHTEAPRPGIDHAQAALRRALQADPRHTDSLVLAAQLSHRFDFDWPGAEALLERAAQAAPGSAAVLHSHAFSLMMRGDFDAAERRLVQARVLDPLSLSLRAHQGLLALYRRDWDGASRALRDLLDLDAQSLLGTSLMACVSLLRGEAAEALAQYRAVAAAHPRQSIGPVGMVQCLAVLGRRDEALAALQHLQSPAGSNTVQPYELAMCQLRLGDADAAQALLQRAVDERDPNALTLPVDPTFDALRHRPGVAALVDRVLGRSREPPGRATAPVPGPKPAPAGGPAPSGAAPRP